MCKYFDDTGYKCPHENLEDSDYCIFHLQDDNKDADDFNKGIKVILETKKDLINFNGFYFPPSTTGFSGSANVMNAKFSRDADFRNAKFSRDAKFMKSEFSGYADFSDAKFSGYADFSDATFSGKADFSDATFCGKADFFSSELNGKIVFIPKKSETIIFEKTYFSDIVRIKADMSKCFFANSNIERVDMTDSEWIRNDDKSKKHLSASIEKFKNILGISETPIIIKEEYKGKPKEYLFSWDEISGNDDKRIIKFLKDELEIEWAKTENISKIDDGKTIIVSNKEKSLSLKLNDEKTKVELKIDDGRVYEFTVETENCKLNIYRKDNWKELEGIYRRLKQSYQKYGDNSTAGKFYYQEMECQRKQLRGISKFINIKNVFKLCGYGERPLYMILDSLIFIIVSAFLYLFGGIAFFGSSVLKIPPNIIDYNLSLNLFDIQWVMSNIGSVLDDFLICLYMSVITFTTLGYGDVCPTTSFSRTVASVEAVFGIIMTALFIFVFTRKMLR